MKKKLETDLVSIAHRILQLKNKSDVNVLFLETQKLYEKLAVLRFVEEHLNGVQPTIGIAALENEIENAFEKQENKIPEADDILPEEEKLASFVPIFVEEEKNRDTIIVAKSIENEIAATKTLISLEDIFGENYTEAEFVKVETLTTKKPKPQIESTFELTFDALEILTEEKETKTASLNEKLAKGILIDLHDRIDFVKHLFNNNNEDYNRVLSQLNSFDELEETKTFIAEIIKPEYNNWENKQEYENRFIAIVAKKFL